MEKNKTKITVFISLALLLLLLTTFGAWWFLRDSNATNQPSSSNSTLVFIMSPASGEEVNAGDIISVQVKAPSSSVITQVDLLVDGKTLGSITESSQPYYWSWQALPVGIHTLLAKATTGDGEEYTSQTVVVNVLQDDGIIDSVAIEGETLGEIGEKFGVSIIEMGEVNPVIPTDAPLKDGQKVKIPVKPKEPATDSPSDETNPDAASGKFPIIIWKIIPKIPVDKSYCYLKSGAENWVKIPKKPFTYLLSDKMSYSQLVETIPAEKIALTVNCWGWIGETLKYLGESKTDYDPYLPQAPLEFNGEHFTVSAIPKMPIKPENFLNKSLLKVPPPFAVREPKTVKECLKHHDNLLAGLVCENLLNAKVKQYNVLVWEWTSKFNWPGNTQWVDKIDGYNVYEINPVTKSEKLLAVVTNPKQKVTAVPIPWGSACYGVKAFVNDAAIPLSPISTYCPGGQPVMEKISLSPTDWITTGGNWMSAGGSEDMGSASAFQYYILNNFPQFGNQDAEVFVGAKIIDEDGLYSEENYAGGVKFNMALPPGIVIQKAVLKYSIPLMKYGATGLAAPTPSSCVSTIGKATQPWSGLTYPNHYTDSISVSALNKNLPIVSLSPFMANEVDVTAIVDAWTLHPNLNYGMVFTPVSAPTPNDGGSGDGGTGMCLSAMSNFSLDIYYLAPASSQ